MKFEAIFNNLLFAAGCVFLIFIIASRTSFSVEMMTPLKDLYSIEAAHTVEYCFTSLSGSKDFITKDFLDRYDKQNIKDLCNIEKPEIKVMVKDLETNKNWVFPQSFSDHSHMIYISIMYDKDEIHPGGMYVKI